MNARTVAVLSSLAVSLLQASAGESISALGALALLPPEAARNVAGITAMDGNPSPERWRFLVCDTHAENGFREYVVADGKIVAQNLASQFAIKITPLEIMAPESIQIDSDAASRIAFLYAEANRVSVSSLRYALRRSPEVPIPVWKIDCFDESEKQVGSVSIAAGDGKVLARLGFVKEPDGTALAAGPSKPGDHSAKAPPPQKRVARQKPVAQRAPTPSPAAPQVIAERVRRAEPVHVERRPKPFRLFNFDND